MSTCLVYLPAKNAVPDWPQQPIVLMPLSFGMAELGYCRIVQCVLKPRQTKRNLGAV